MTMLKIKNGLLYVALLPAFFLGCHSDPYNGSIANMHPLSQPPGNPTFQIKAPDDLLLVEGSSADFTVAGSCTDGPVKIQVTGLPPGASFVVNSTQTVPQSDGTNPTTTNGSFSWTPGPNMGRDPNDPSVITRVYPITITATDKYGFIQAEKKVELVVHPKSETLTVTSADGTTPVQIQEGQAYTATLNIQDVNSPTPQSYNATAVNLPAGAAITQPLSNTSFAVSFTPDFTVAKSSDVCQMAPGAQPTQACKRIDWHVVVVSGTGRAAQLTMTWFVMNVSQPPQVLAPQAVTAVNGMASFVVNLLDVNGEGMPALTSSDFTSPTITSLGGAAATGAANSYQLFQVNWQAPQAINPNRVQPMATPTPTPAPVTTPVSFQACSMSVNSAALSCSTFSVPITH